MWKAHTKALLSAHISMQQQNAVENRCNTFSSIIWCAKIYMLRFTISNMANTHTHTQTQALPEPWQHTYTHTDICRHALDGKRVILYYLLNPLQSIYVENCFISLHISQSTSSSLLYPCDCASVCVCVCVRMWKLWQDEKKRKFKYVGIIVEEKIFLVASHSLGKLNQGTPKVVDIFRPQDLPPSESPFPRWIPTFHNLEAKRLCAAIYVIFC